MIDFDLVDGYLHEAKGIAFDTCHKIYVLMDDKQVDLMREYEYDFVITKSEMDHTAMLAKVKEWFEESCPLRFVEAVATNEEDPNLGFTTLIEQGASDKEECEDCGFEDCDGYCEDEDEDYEDEEDED